MKTLQEFLNDLGARESSGNYKAFNKYPRNLPNPGIEPRSLTF